MSRLIAMPETLLTLSLRSGQYARSREIVAHFAMGDAVAQQVALAEGLQRREDQLRGAWGGRCVFAACQPKVVARHMHSRGRPLTRTAAVPYTPWTALGRACSGAISLHTLPVADPLEMVAICVDMAASSAPTLVGVARDCADSKGGPVLTVDAPAPATHRADPSGFGCGGLLIGPASQALARMFVDHAQQLAERSRPPSGKSAELYAHFTTVSNALARVAFVVERLEQAKPAVAIALANANAAAFRDRDTAWAMGLGGALVGSTVREAITGHVALPADHAALQSTLDRDGAVQIRLAFARLTGTFGPHDGVWRAAAPGEAVSDARVHVWLQGGCKRCCYGCNLSRTSCLA